MTAENNLIKTVIVIGAGASKDFAPRQNANKPDGDNKIISMPTGEELVRMMAEFGGKYDKEFDEEDKIISQDYTSESAFRKIHSLKIYEEAKEFYQKNANSIANNTQLFLEIIDKLKPVFSALAEEKHAFLGKTTYQFSDGTTNLAFFNWTQNENKYIENSNYCLRHCFMEGQVHIGTAIKNIFKNNEIKKFQNSRKEYFKHHLKLAKLLKFYDPTSIDNFLNSIKLSLISINIGDEANNKNPLSAEEEDQERKKLVKAGKELIAFYLLRAENKEIFNSDNKIWYRWLREALINGNSHQNQNEKVEPEKIILDKIKSLQIVSFNYDRSLSFFIEEKMNHNFLVGDDKINLATKLKEKIYYPYGCLYGEKDGFKKLDYGEFSKKLEEHSLQDFFEKYIKHYAERIYTIHDDRNSENNFKLEIDDSCKRIAPTGRKQNFYFLGFGFIRENTAQITDIEKKTELSNNRKIFYTNFDNSKKIEDLIKHSFLTDSSTYGPYEKHPSPKGVYDAINEDFSLIIEP